jgi:hypothetical protein
MSILCRGVFEKGPYPYLLPLPLNRRERESTQRGRGWAIQVLPGAGSPAQALQAPRAAVPGLLHPFLAAARVAVLAC